MTLVLCWDIDGTLLTTARAGIFAWEEATREVVGQTVDFSTLETAGLTDVEIAARILDRFQAAGDPGRIEELVRRYEAWLPSCLSRRRGHVLPGVHALLDYLRLRRDVLSILLTGNTRTGARTKLRHYGLDHYFTYGAFADGAVDRAGIARRALSLVAGLLGSAPRAEWLYVIGDTPHDIACARSIGARSVAIATGAYSVEALEQHGPWWALQQLPEPAVFIDRLEAR